MIDDIVFNILVSFDTFVDILCWFILSIALYFDISNFISWFIILPLLMYRWQRKFFKKFLSFS